MLLDVIPKLVLAEVGLDHLTSRAESNGRIELATDILEAVADEAAVLGEEASVGGKVDAATNHVSCSEGRAERFASAVRRKDVSIVLILQVSSEGSKREVDRTYTMIAIGAIFPTWQTT